MTTELEKQFFDTFGIERKRNHEVTLEAISGGVRSANLSQKTFYEYPQITDRQYLELICLYNRHDNLFISSASEIENLKIHILSSLVSAFERENTEELKRQVQAIFEGER